MNLLEHLDDAFKRFSNHPALEDRQSTIRYADLHIQIKRIVSIIAEQHLFDACIAIRKSNPIEEIINKLAILYSGNHYFFIPHVETIDVYTDVPIRAELHGVNLTVFDDSTKIFESDWYKNTDIGQKKMCVYATSASSGKPKYAVHSYHSIYKDTLRQIEENHYHPLDKVDLLFSNSFSAALASIFPSLLTGACVVCMEDVRVQNIYPFWKKHAITVSTLTSSVFRALTQSDLHQKDLSLRFVCISGERITEDDVQRFFESFPSGVTLQIAYATTETRTISSAKLTSTRDYITGHVGSVVKKVEIDQSSSENGQIGMICVWSNDIAIGYYQKKILVPFSTKSDLTYYPTGDLGSLTDKNELFLTGRGDSQLKIDGKWVDLHEIEKIIKQTHQVNCLILPFIGKNGFDYLISFIESGQPEILGKDVFNTVPDIPVVPKFHYELTTFPINSHGKIDKEQLRKIHMEHLENNTPLTKDLPHHSSRLERIRQIWKDVLETDEVHDESHFFRDLGGTSLLSMVMITEVEKALHLQLKTFKISDLGTLSHFVTHISTAYVLPRIDTLNTVVEGRKNLIFIETGEGHSYYSLLKGFIEEANVYILRFDLYSRSFLEEDQQPFHQLADLIEKNIKGDVCLIGNSFHGYIAAKIAECTNEPMDLILLDTPFYKNNGDSILQNSAPKKWNYYGSLMGLVFQPRKWKQSIYSINRAVKATRSSPNDQSDFAQAVIQIVKRNDHVIQIPSALYLYFEQSGFTSSKDRKDWEKITRGRFRSAPFNIGHLDFNNPDVSEEIASCMKAYLKAE